MVEADSVGLLLAVDKFAIGTVLEVGFGLDCEIASLVVVVVGNEALPVMVAAGMHLVDSWFVGKTFEVGWKLLIAALSDSFDRRGTLLAGEMEADFVNGDSNLDIVLVEWKLSGVV